MHARVFGTPSTTTRQSKQTPIPQKTPRGSPPTVVRVAMCPSASSTVATVSPSYASTRRPSRTISTRGPRSSSGPSGSLDTRDHLRCEQLQRMVAPIDRQPGRPRPEEQPVAARPVVDRPDPGRDLVRRSDQVAVPRQLLGALEQLAAAPFAVAVVLVEEVLGDVLALADVDRGVDRDLAVGELAVEPDYLGRDVRVRHEVAPKPRGSTRCRRSRAAEPEGRLRLLARRRRDEPARPGAPRDLDQLLRPASPLVERDAERLELRVPVAESEPQLEPPAAQLVDDRRVLGEADRVLERRDQDRRADAHRLRALRDCRPHGKYRPPAAV